MQVDCQIMPLDVAIKYYNRWDCDVDTRVQNSYGNVEFRNGNSYHGNFKNGLMDGKGRYTWKDGLTYQGQFSSNSVTGQGKLSWPNGSYYIGSIKDGKRHGLGQYYCSIDKSTYKGKWNKGSKQGKGILTFSNGSVYDGQFKDGLRSGFGRMKYTSGNQYQGQWLSDKKQGKGTMNWFTSCQKYEGKWKNDVPSGLGSYFWYQNKNDFKNIKSIFKGQWKVGKRQGFGTLYYNNGCRLEGSFSNNLKEGVCFIIDQFGDGKLQHYSNDKSTAKKSQISKKQQKFHIKLPQIGITNKKQNILQNNEATENNYTKFIDFQNDVLDDSITNLLLRQNSHLRNWYKSIINTINKQIFTGLNMQGLWRLIKDMKLTDQHITIAKLNRQFFKGLKSRYEVDFIDKKKLQFIKKNQHLLTSSNYSTIQWKVFADEIKNIKLDWNNSNWQGKIMNVQKISLSKQLDLHNANHTILFRHFIIYLLHLAILIYQGQLAQNHNITFRKCLEDLFASIKQTTNGVPLTLRTQKNCSEILTNASHSHTKINIAEEYLSTNRQLFKILNRQKANMLNTKDETVAVRQIYCLLKKCNILKEPAEKMLFLQKIQRKMNIKFTFLKKQYKNYYPAFEKILLKSSQFSHILSYQMIQQQFDEMIYLILNRKIGNTNSKEDFFKKYKELIQIMIQQIDSNTKQAKASTKTVAFNFKRYSEKDRIKDELLKRLQEERQLKIEQQAKRRQRLRQQGQRKKMYKQDRDIKDEDQQQYSEQYYD